MTQYIGGVLQGAAGPVTADETSASTGTVNDHALAATAPITLLRFTDAAGLILTGLAGGAANRVVIMMYTGAGTLSIYHEDAGSSAANRFSLPGGVAHGFFAGYVCALVYDATAARWKMIARTQ